MTLTRLLKSFIKKCPDYYVEIVDCVAELYIANISQVAPALMLELRNGDLVLNFKRDLPPNLSAKITADLLINVNAKIILEAEFMPAADGSYVYGDDAANIFHNNVYDVQKHSKTLENAGLSGAFFVVSEPIPTLHSDFKRITKNINSFGDE